jgi:hypothetical protein
MASFTWDIGAGASGLWNDGGLWTEVIGGTPTTGTVPSGVDGALIISGVAVSGQGNASNIVGALTIDAAGGFDIAYGDSFGFLTGTSFTVAAGLANAGAILAEDATNLTVAGAVDNTGLIQLDSSSAPLGASSVGDNTALIISGPTVTLSGGGTIALSDGANNQIYGALGSGTSDGYNTLVNVDNTITGAMASTPLAWTTSPAA